MADNNNIEIRPELFDKVDETKKKPLKLILGIITKIYKISIIKCVIQKISKDKQSMVF